MAKLTTKLNIVSDNINQYSGSFTNRELEMIDNYDNVVQLKERLDNSDAFIKIAAAGSSISGVKAGAGARLLDAKLIVIKNCGDSAIELSFENKEVGAGDELVDNSMYNTMIIAPDEYMVLPNQRIAAYSSLTSAGNASSLDNAATSTLKTDSGADNDDVTEDAMTDDTNSTRVYIEQATSASDNGTNLFRVGDTIRLDNEIMRVTAIGTGADLANTYLDVERGLFGSTIAVHADDVAIEFPFLMSIQILINIVNVKLIDLVNIKHLI